MVKKIEKFMYRSSFLVQFDTLPWFKPATLLKMILFAGILPEIWPEILQDFDQKEEQLFRRVLLDD